MNMKQIIILISLVVLVILVFLYLNKPVPSDDIILDGIPNEEVMIIDEDDIPKELIREIPDNFADVEMTTYRSVENNYEITYPKEWVGILSPERVGPEFILEDYAIYPKDIPYGPSPIFNIRVSSENIDDFFNQKLDIGKPVKITLKNGLVGYKAITKLAQDDVVFYAFSLNEKEIISILYWPNEAYQVSEEEAMWVLSTLKVYNE